MRYSVFADILPVFANSCIQPVQVFSPAAARTVRHNRSQKYSACHSFSCIRRTSTGLSTAPSCSTVSSSVMQVCAQRTSVCSPGRGHRNEQDSPPPLPRSSARRSRWAAKNSSPVLSRLISCASGMYRAHTSGSASWMAQWFSGQEGTVVPVFPSPGQAAAPANGSPCQCWPGNIPRHDLRRQAQPGCNAPQVKA